MVEGPEGKGKKGHREGNRCVFRYFRRKFVFFLVIFGNLRKFAILGVLDGNLREFPFQKGHLTSNLNRIRRISVFRRRDPLDRDTAEKSTANEGRSTSRPNGSSGADLCGFRVTVARRVVQG